MTGGDTILTPHAACAKRAPMKKLIPVAAALVLLPLSACDTQAKKEAANVAAAADEAAAAHAAAAAAPLPPAIRDDKTFRCKDNSLAYVTFFDGDTQVTFRDKQDGAATVMKAAKAGDPFTAEDGTKLTGNEKGVTVTRPGKSAVACHV